MSMPDNYSVWSAHDAEMEAMLQRLPVCSCCKEHIQDDTCYKVDDKVYCEGCMRKKFEVWTEDLMD